MLKFAASLLSHHVWYLSELTKWQPMVKWLALQIHTKNSIDVLSPLEKGDFFRKLCLDIETTIAKAKCRLKMCFSDQTKTSRTSYALSRKSCGKFKLVRTLQEQKKEAFTILSKTKLSSLSLYLLRLFNKYCKLQWFQMES